jgi:hypothetical protein
MHTCFINMCWTDLDTTDARQNTSWTGPFTEKHIDARMGLHCSAQFNIPALYNLHNSFTLVFIYWNFRYTDMKLANLPT